MRHPATSPRLQTVSSNLKGRPKRRLPVLAARLGCLGCSPPSLTVQLGFSNPRAAHANTLAGLTSWRCPAISLS